MAEQTAGTAVIRVRLAISPEDRAILSGGAGRVGPGSVAAGAGVVGPRGGLAIGAPGRGGASVTTRGGGMIGGGMIGAAIALAYASPFGAPIMDLGKGVVNRSQQIGRDFSEMIGAGAFARRGTIPQRATDATVEQLGKAANFATKDQILALGAINEQLATLDVEGENKVRDVMGTKRIEEIGERLLNVLNAIAKFLGMDTSSPSTSGGIGARARIG